ncbi:MAG TPA: PA2779 family protein [Spongiibacteraceae bacterium]|nr:PA2779 family protein [Spongiibacteraceae bacterium]
MNIRLLRRTSWTLLFSLSTLLLPVAPVHAALVSTDQLVSSAQITQNRERVRMFLQRQDVRDMLQQRGVDANVALTRVDAMTDSEVQTVASQLDKLPAGGDVLGTVVFVFLVLLVTDILGFTKIFPFTRPVR